MFWHDLNEAFSEIFRILKPGGKALIGGGYGLSTPEDIVHQIKAKHSNKSSIPKLNFSDIENILATKGGKSDIISNPGRGFWIKWIR